MRSGMNWILGGVAILALATTGCRSPYHADKGAAFGAGTGAVLGAIVGDATGHNALAGAAIGTVAGAMVGGAVGQSLDDIEARNRAEIEARMGRQLQAGAVTIPDVISMSQAQVSDDLIINHVRANGMSAPLSSQDLIVLQQAGVSSKVVSVMQNPPPPQQARQTVIVQERPVVVRQAPPVIVERNVYWGPRPRPTYGASFHWHNRH